MFRLKNSSIRILATLNSFRQALYCGLAALTACTAPKSIVAELQPRSLKAVNTEETLSRRDEVMLAYSLTAFDAQNKPVGVVNGGWGVELMKQGQQFNLQQAPGQVNAPKNPALPIRITMPRNGRVVVSMVLIEVDDLTQAEQMLNKVRQIHNLVSAPAALVLSTTEALTPLKYVAAGLAAAGVGIKLIDQFDSDDLLGQSSVELKEADFRKPDTKRLIHVPARFTGRNMRDTFTYELEYDVALKTVSVK